MPYTVMPDRSVPGQHYVLHTEGMTSRVVAIVWGKDLAERVASLLNLHGTVDVPFGALPTPGA